jgi:hypothetical protein
LSEKLIILTLVLLISVVPFLGCTEFDSIIDDATTEIDVSVSTRAYVYQWNSTRKENEPLGGYLVRFDISKTDGLDFTYSRETYDGTGYTDYVDVGYHLRKGQTIRITYKVTGTGATFMNYDQKTLSWDAADEAAIDGKFSWKPEGTIFYHG